MSLLVQVFLQVYFDPSSEKFANFSLSNVITQMGLH